MHVTHFISTSSKFRNHNTILQIPSDYESECFDISEVEQKLMYLVFKWSDRSDMTNSVYIVINIMQLINYRKQKFS